MGDLNELVPPPGTEDDGDKPWERTLAQIWRWATRGKRWVAIGFVVIAMVIPALAGVATFYAEAWGKVRALVNQSDTTITEGEQTALDEWVAVISHFTSKTEAEAYEKKFRERYEKYETWLRNAKDGPPYPMWRYDIFVVRDPAKNGSWLLIIDTFYGTSNRPAVDSELSRLSHEGGQDPEAQNTYQRLFVNSHALCYSKRQFEITYGRIIPEPKQKQDKPCDEGHSL